MVAMTPGGLLPDDGFCDGASQWVFGVVSAAGCEARDQIKGAAASVGEGAIGSLADSIAASLSELFTTVTSFWVKIPTPGVTETTCTKGGECKATPNETLGFLWEHLSWMWGLLLVFSVIFAAAQLAWTQRKEPARDLARSLVTFAVTSTAGVAGLGLAIEAGDQFSAWIISESNGTDLGASIAESYATGGLSAGVVTVLGILGILLGGVQAILMIFRLAILTLMMAALPLAASATNTGWGRNWFRQTVAWTVAFLLYKPVAAVVYAASYRLLSGGLLSGSALLSFVTGIAMMALAILALPATMKAIVPAMNSASNSGGLGAVMAVGATGAAMVATGGASAAASGSSAATGVAAGGKGAAMSGGAGAQGSTIGVSAAAGSAGQPPATVATADKSGSASGWGAAENSMRGAAGLATAVERTVDHGDPDNSNPSGSDRPAGEV